MPNIDPAAKDWQLEWSGRIGKAIQDRRKELGVTAQALAKRTDDLGFPISRVAISKIESNSRAGKLDVAEIAVLAAALGIPPVMLLYPGLPHTAYSYLPARRAFAMDALLWFTGENPGLPESDGPSWETTLSTVQPLFLSRELFRAELAFRSGIAGAKAAAEAGDKDKADSLNAFAQEQLARLDQVISTLRAQGLPVISQYSSVVQEDA